MEVIRGSGNEGIRGKVRFGKEEGILLIGWWVGGVAT